MFEKIAEWLCTFAFLPHIRRIDRKIGYALVFRDIPHRFMNGIVRWDMTGIWRRFGLQVRAGTNYWTIGSIHNGTSSRYDRNSPEYQSWLGGYMVKLSPGNTWTLKDHVNLATADQNSWLRTYGDPNPITSFEGWGFLSHGTITSGEYSGTLYEGGCITHSDVGTGKRTFKGFLSPFVQAAFFNHSNNNLQIKGQMLTPKPSKTPYETLRLHGYLAIFDLENGVHAILYGNGAIIPREEGEVDTFSVLKDDLLHAIRRCEIVKI